MASMCIHFELRKIVISIATALVNFEKARAGNITVKHQLFKAHKLNSSGSGNNVDS